MAPLSPDRPLTQFKIWRINHQSSILWKRIIIIYWGWMGEKQKENQWKKKKKRDSWWDRTIRCFLMLVTSSTHTCNEILVHYSHWILEEVVSELHKFALQFQMVTLFRNNSFVFQGVHVKWLSSDRRFSEFDTFLSKVGQHLLDLIQSRQSHQTKLINQRII